jgi:sugar (pentulose or hexulose) kinase
MKQNNGEVIIGIDVGSTRTKIAVVNVSDRLPKEFNFETPYIHDEHYNYQIDCNHLIKSCEAIIEQFKGDHCRLAVTGQMHGIGFLDEFGRPLGNYLSWRSCKKKGDLAAILDFAGVDVVPKNMDTIFNKSSTGLRLLWDLHQRQLINKKACYISFLPEIVANGLSEFTNAVSLSSLHAAALAPPDSKSFFEKPFATLGLTPFEHIFEHKYDAAKRSNIIGAVTGDFQATIFGANLQSDEVLLNFGTAGQICQISDQDWQVPTGLERRSYFQDHMILCITGLPSGDYMLNALASEKDESDIVKYIAEAFKMKLKIFLTDNSVPVNFVISGNLPDYLPGLIPAILNDEFPNAKVRRSNKQTAQAIAEMV